MSDNQNPLVYYCSYGSNIFSSRFNVYLNGGHLPGMLGSRPPYPGARDSTAPRDDVFTELPYGMYFARESGTWAGGVCFIDYTKHLDENHPATTYSRGYLITLEQFNDVVAQENAEKPGTLGISLKQHNKLVTGGAGTTVELRPGWYSVVVCAGIKDGHPILTFSCPRQSLCKHYNPPSAAYLTVIAKGLQECGLSAKRVQDYLHTRAFESLPGDCRNDLNDQKELHSLVCTVIDAVFSSTTDAHSGESKQQQPPTELPSFELERYFAKYEFKVAAGLLCCSDPESLTLRHLLDLADEECRGLYDNLSLGYPESRGHPLLLREIASLYSGLAEDNVLCAVPEEGIYIAMSCLLNPGDHAIVTFPGYQSLYQVALSRGCDVYKWFLQPDTDAGAWRLDLDELERAIQPNTKLIVINFPHNPTGHLITRNEYDRVIDIARKHNCYLFSDEMYRFLEHGGPDARLPSACELYERAITLCGLSKSFGLPGLRLGWLATQDTSLLKRIATMKDYTTICGSAPSEILGIIALRNKDRIIGDHMKTVRANLAAVKDLCARHSKHLQFMKPEGSTIAFIRLRSGTAAEFCERLVEEREILLLPSQVFDVPADKYGHFVRFGYGRKNCIALLKELSTFLCAMS